MYLDLVFWGQEFVSGWSIDELPLYCLVNFWDQIAYRKKREENLLNHSSAYLMAAKQSTEKKAGKPADWLPHDLSGYHTHQYSAKVIGIIKDLRDKKLLPMAMISDLVKDEIIPKD